MKGKVKEKEKELEPVPSKTHNYIILIILFVACIAFVLYICQVYKLSVEEKKKVPIISGYLMEIYHNDLEHYVLDNPSTVIYMCTANDDTCRSFERDFKKLLKKKNYNEEIIYLNLTDVDQEEFVKSFNEKYHYKIELTTHYPAFVYFEDGNVDHILQGSEKKPLTITKVKQFLELNHIGE